MRVVRRLLHTYFFPPFFPFGFVCICRGLARCTRSVESRYACTSYSDGLLLFFFFHIFIFCFSFFFALLGDNVSRAEKTPSPTQWAFFFCVSPPVTSFYHYILLLLCFSLLGCCSLSLAISLIYISRRVKQLVLFFCSMCLFAMWCLLCGAAARGLRLLSPLLTTVVDAFH